MDPFQRVLIFDTSGRVGRVALAQSGRIMDIRVLSEARRHARDLPVRVKEMLVERGWPANEVTATVATIGPGSYTGLRVGIASAKAFAYATNCALFAVPTFDAIAIGVEPGDHDLAVVADAQQGYIYVGPYGYSSASGWSLTGPIAVVSARDWVGGLKPGTRLIGPGLALVKPLLGCETVVLESNCEATPKNILARAQSRTEAYRSNPWSIEPIYLRGSSAEEKRKRAQEASASEKT